MELSAIIWLVMVVLLLAMEAATVGLTTIWFAAGGLIAALAAYLGAGIVVQLLLFFIISLVLLIFTRPIALRLMNKGVEKTNINSMVGKKAIVTEKINNLHETGKVRIQDVDWLARNVAEDEEILSDNIVVVREVHGVTLYVEKIEK